MNWILNAEKLFKEDFRVGSELYGVTDDVDPQDATYLLPAGSMHKYEGTNGYAFPLFTAILREGAGHV
jgi:hypothetical protein